MNRQLEEIFNECVERLKQGDSIQNCLLSYPEVAAELEILLRTAANVNWRASLVQPRPEFKYWARNQFINAQYAASQAKEVKTHPTFFNLQRAWVPAVAMVLLVIFSSVGTAAAASDAMPDQPLYTVKLATEQVRLTLAFSDEDKAELNAQLAETRSQEIVAMVNKGKTEQVTVTTERLVQHLEAAEVAITKVETKQTLPASTKATTTAPVLPPAQSVPVQPTPTTPAPTQSQPVPVQPTPTTPAPTTTAPSVSPPTEKSRDTTGQQEGQTTTAQAPTRAEKLRESLKASISKNLTALENARDKAPEKTKEALQRAIEITKTRQTQIQQKPSTVPQNKPGTTSPQTPSTGTVQPKPPQDIKNPQNVPNPTDTKRDTGDTSKPVTPITNSPSSTVTTTDKR